MTKTKGSKYETLAEASAAAQALGIQTKTEFEKRYKEDPHLPIQVNVVYAEEWVSWPAFLRNEVKQVREYYASYEEATAAAQALGIRSGSEYLQRYKEDPGLPSRPDEKYRIKWEGWPVFLGKVTKEFYPTLAEASAAAQALGVRCVSEYKKRYNEDPRLANSPDQKYREDWEGWLEFFGMEPKELYVTYAEASDAAQALGFKTRGEYFKLHQEDPCLPARPAEKYRTEWESWSAFLGLPDKKYALYAEASAAAQALGIQSTTEYNKRYKEDPRLPRNPQRKYAAKWESFPVFLGVKQQEVYATYAEASEAAQALGIETQIEYRKRYKEDPRLVYGPHEKYVEDWEGWPEFLGMESREFYATLAEASAAVRALEIKTMREYKERYREDSGLPSAPWDKYEDWQNAAVFLATDDKFYFTCAEASSAAQALGITSSKVYYKRYHEDTRLPNSPHQTYAEEWVSWPHFLGTDTSDEPLNGAFKDCEEFCPEWKRALEKYILGGVNQQNKITHLRPFLVEVVIPAGCADWPGKLLDRETPFPKGRFEAYVNATGETVKKGRFNICSGFLDWCLDEYCSEESDDGELIRLPGYRNPIPALMGHITEQFQSFRPSESVKPVLPFSVIARARKHLIPPDCKSFSDLACRHDFLKESWFEVDPFKIDEEDPDCIWRKRVKDRKVGGERYSEKVIEMWSPVKLVAIFTLLMVPLRGQQIMWLDSGEADSEIPVLNGVDIEWTKNRSALGGYGRKQSFIKKYLDDEIGMFITTNKTGGKPYSVPYMPEELAYWIIRLREWQCKYNSLDVPTPWTEIDLRQHINEQVLRRRGSQTFLFRDPCSGKGNKVSPMKTTTAFRRPLAALLAAIQIPGEQLAERDPKCQKKTKEWISPFTTHSLRTSLITALVIDGGCPPHVVMKLVGHATIVMTLYYSKVGPTRMREELAEAEKRALQANVDRLKDLVLANKIESAKPHLIATDGNTLSELDRNWPNAAYQFMDYGFCPMAGQACHKGGPALVNTSTRLEYASVEAGYLGRRNCPRCRFFITGPAWLGGLQSLVNQIFLEINAIKSEYMELVEAQEKLEDEKFDAEREGSPFEYMKALNQTTAILEEKGQKLDLLLTDFQHVYKLMRQSIALVNEGEIDEDGGRMQQLIVNEQGAVEMSLEESESEFRLLASICKDAEVYQSASASRAAPKLAQMIDTFAEKNGFMPGLFKLSGTQQRRVANQIADLLLKRCNGDWSRTEQIVMGDLTLADLKDEEALIPLRSEIARALRDENNSLKKIGGEDFDA